MENTKETAKYLLKQHQKKQRFRILPDAFMPRDIQQAYEVQDHFHQISGRGKLGGFKIALASKVQQQLTGINYPLCGRIYLNEILTSPACVYLKDYHGFGLEFELAITLSNDLNKQMGIFNETNIIQYIDSVSPAFELIIDRNADYRNLEALTMIADNAWCSGIVLGDPIADWKNLNLNKLQSRLFWNNEKPQLASVGAANPISSLVWIANLITSQDRKLLAGDVIITGSVIKTRAPKVGDKVRYNIANLSEVEITVK